MIATRASIGFMTLLMTIATIFFIVGVATNNWSEGSSRRTGLWEHCSRPVSTVTASVNLGVRESSRTSSMLQVVDTIDCYKIDSDCAISRTPFGFTTMPKCRALQATRAFAILAVIFAIPAMFFAMWHFMRPDYGAKSNTSLLAGLSAVCGLIAMAVWIYYHRNTGITGPDFGFSFILETIGWILALFAAIGFSNMV